MDRLFSRIQGRRIRKEEVVESDDFSASAFVEKYYRCDNIDDFFDTIKKNRLNETQRVEIIKHIIEKPSRFTFNCDTCIKHFGKFEISDENERRKIARLVAEKYPHSCATYFQNFEISDKVYRIQLAGIITRYYPGLFIDHRQNFEIDGGVKNESDRQIFEREMNRIMNSIAKHLFGIEEKNGMVIQELREFFFDGEISYQLEQMLLYAIENNNRPDDFSESGLPLISYFFQQGGGKFFANLKIELRQIPKDKKTFFEQYRYLEEKTRPNVLSEINDNELQKEVGVKKILVFYFRYKSTVHWGGSWQGSDLLQSAMMIEDLATLIQQNRLGNFDKLVVVPRLSYDLPFFVKDELKKKFSEKWVDEHLEVTNKYRKYDKDPNAHWIELVDGTPHSKNVGILGGVFDTIGRSYREDCLICEDIFWPDPDGLKRYIYDSKTNTGFGKKQASTLKAVRESLLNKVIELDELVGQEG